ncbi:MAG: 2-oxoacid:acceptor oxidoreductase family protein, partial [Oscillospiraceae bacterium]|nr:2-oxoacid:acceptor oxidoreductase family protein [Oscillospiraceae bacterium]
TAETIGMAQRGGSVTSHVRLGEGVYAPLIPKGRADALLGFEPGEAVRSLAYLRADGVAVVSTRGIQPSAGGGYEPDAALRYLRDVCPRAVTVDAEAVFRACGSYRSLNIAILGAASRCGALDFTLGELEAAMRALMSEKNAAASLSALRLDGVTA